VLTALTAPVPAIDPVLARIEAEYPGATRPDIPAHFTFLYPFVPQADVGPDTIDWLTALSSRHAGITLELPEVRIEPGFVYLYSPLLQPLTDEIRGHWSDLVPYLGRFGPNPVAHLSLAIDVAEQTETLEIATLAASLLPRQVRVDKLWLAGHDNGAWRTLATFSLAVPEN
jgi:hypothetical protein